MEAIGLNPIRLDAIGIDPIRLNAIRLGVPGASSGSVRPYIDPEVLASLVAVCICDGKSNNDPDRAVIKNFIDPANPFVISNAAYKLNSGFGKYEEDFTTLNNRTPAYIELNPSSILVQGKVNDLWLAYTTTSPFNLMKIRIKGLPIGGRFEYRYYNGVVFSTIVMEEDGEYKLPASQQHNNGIGFRINDRNLNWTGFIVEQIPSFQGALITDGVNDLITSTKSVQEMLGGSNEITVVSMIHQIEANVNNLTNTNNIRVGSSFIRNSVVNVGKTGIYGYTFKNTVSLINNILGDKNDYTAQGDLTGTSNKFSVEGMIEGSTISQTSQVAWYWTFIAKRALTTDQINQVIAYYNLDKYVKPDIYYDVKKQGLTNDTPDADWYLKDFSGNGHDMQLYNYGKTPESGINEEGGLQSDGVTDYGKAENLPIYKDYTVVADREWTSSDPRSMILASKTNGVDNGAFLFEDFEASSVRVYSFGTATSVSIDKNRIISYQSKYLYNKTSIGIGIALDGNVLCLYRGRDLYPFYANAAIWSFLLFPYTLSEFLLERQLKRYKLGTLYPDMVEFRPIIKSNVDIDKYLFINKTTNKQLNIGDYFAITDTIEIQIYLTDRERQEITNFTVNGKEFTPAFTDTSIRYLYNIENFGEATGKKSPQKIDITIDEYIRYEDIVQPYPYIVKIRNNDGYIYTYGDKLKVGSEIIRGKVINLLPELYSVANGIFLNGQQITNSEATVVVSKNMVFSHGGNTYLKANEPNCIADPQRLSIPNSSYKILGYIPDISGHGNHLKINNSAYAGMSGANGYKYDWNTWRISKNGITSTITDNSLHITSLKEQYNPNQALFEPKTVADTGDKSNFKVNITGLTSSIKCTFNNAGAIIKELVNGVNEISVDLVAGWYGFMITALDGSIIGDCDITIQQIGEYEGSFCLDGVDDFITIPTLSHGAKQVLMKVNWNSINTIAYDHRNGIGSNDMFAIYLSDINEAIAYNARNSGQTYIDGILNTNIIASQLKDITHNITITNNDVNANNSGILRIGSAYTNSLYAQMALFSFMSFDDISSEDEIKELNDIVGIEGGYVESPDYYWDAFGKSNNNANDIEKNRNSIQDQVYKQLHGLPTTNSRFLELKNFVFNEKSGYGGISSIYKFATEPVGGQWQYYASRVSFEVLNDGDAVRITEARTTVALFYIGNPNKKAYYKITGISAGKGIKFGNDSGLSVWSKVIEEDGVYEIDWSSNINTDGTRITACIMTNGWTGECDIVIEQVSQYPNGLVSDGVEDHLINTVIPAFTDFTVIAKRMWINKDEPLNECFIHKGVVNTSISQSAFMLEYEITDDTYYRSASFGGYINVERVNRPESITYQTTKSYNGTPIIKGSGIDTQGLVIGAATNNYWKGVFYKMMLYSKTIDQLSINMLKNLFAKDELIDVNNPIFKKEEL
jgi:hypothetical protein|nr:MAG TPA: hypothetical protein [Caudoviricetes sp.]